MAPLSLQQEQKLQDVVREVLKTALDDGAEQQPLGEHDDDPATLVAAAVRCAVEAEITRFLEARNAARGDALMRLPAELATAVFRLLDLRGRVAASHVSRAWRRTALADGALWNAVRLRGARPWSRNMLETMLARSGLAAPFAFEWATHDELPRALRDALLAHIGRLGALVVWNGALNDVLNAVLPPRRAPCLRRLVPGDYAIAAPPADWGPQYVPRLEVLKLLKALLPAGLQPFDALVSFKATLVEGSAVPVLAHVFPRLVKLELGGLSQDAVDTLGPPPPSCKKIDLGSTSRGGLLDYSSFLRGCYDKRISDIWLYSSVSVVPSVEEFAHATRGKCRMTITGEKSLVLESAEDGVLREVHSYDPLPILRELASFASLDRLHDLSLPLALLLDIQLSPRPDTLFASLHRLAIVVAPEDILTMRRLSSGGTPPLEMPRLAELTVDAHNLKYDRDDGDWEPARSHLVWLREELPVMFSLLVATERPCLEAVEVVLARRFEAMHFGARTDLGALRGLAGTFRALDQLKYYHEHPSLSDRDDDED